MFESHGVHLIWVDNLIKYVSGHRTSGGSEPGGAFLSGEAGEALIALPSLRLSATKIIGAQLGGNATNVQQHIPRIAAALVHNGALCRTGLVTG